MRCEIGEGFKAVLFIEADKKGRRDHRDEKEGREPLSRFAGMKRGLYFKECVEMYPPVYEDKTYEKNGHGLTG